VDRPPAGSTQPHRTGKTNTQIGEELGISLDGAKWHVSEILSKLQAESREEAADYWRRYNGIAPRFERIFRGLAGGVSTKWVAGTAAVMVAGVATAVVVAIAINRSSEVPGTASPTQSVATPPGGGGSNPGGPQPGLTTRISVGQPVASIPDSIMYVVTGCIQCDGPDETLQKHVTDADGRLTTTTLLRSNEGVLGGWTLGSAAASADGATLAALICDQEYCGAMGQPSPDARWRVLLSSDQGSHGRGVRSHWQPRGPLECDPHGFALTSTVGGGDGAVRTFVSYLNKELTTLTSRRLRPGIHCSSATDPCSGPRVIGPICSVATARRWHW
jgi:hypothetical protein